MSRHHTRLLRAANLERQDARRIRHRRLVAACERMMEAMAKSMIVALDEGMALRVSRPSDLWPKSPLRSEFGAPFPIPYGPALPVINWA